MAATAAAALGEEVYAEHVQGYDPECETLPVALESLAVKPEVLALLDGEMRTLLYALGEKIEKLESVVMMTVSKGLMKGRASRDELLRRLLRERWRDLRHEAPEGGHAGCLCAPTRRCAGRKRTGLHERHEEVRLRLVCD